MADYQSLLTRAVANLPSGSPAAARQAIYDRARKALLTQLRTLRPPLPESDISREETALDRAIAQVEAKFASPDVGPSAPTPEASQEAGPASSPGPATATSAAAARPMSSSEASEASAQPSPTGQQQQPSPAPAQSPPRPAAMRPPAPTLPPRDAPPPATKTAPPPVRTVPRAPSSAPQAPTKAATLQAPPVHAPRPPRADEATAAPPIVSVKADGSAPAPANLAKVAPGAQGQSEASTAPPIGASREGADSAPAPTLAPPIDPDRIGAPKAEFEGVRPQAPTVSETPPRKSWPWLALAAALGIVLSVAAVAIAMRQKPQDLAISPPAEPQQDAQPQAPAKIAQRAQPSPEQSGAPAAAGEQPSASAQQGAAAPPPSEAESGPTLPATARAAMLIASPDNPQTPVVNLGSTVWSTVPAAAGQPQTVAVKADADIPDLKMHATMILRKNTDPTLEATHTIDLKFSFTDGAPITGFKDVGLPQVRKLEATASEALTSVKVKISDVYFLVALANGTQDVSRNLDLLKTRAWFDFPLLLNDNRIAKLVFQKSADGEAMLEKAFEAWK